jgi:hypothetical protein
MMSGCGAEDADAADTMTSMQAAQAFGFDV